MLRWLRFSATPLPEPMAPLGGGTLLVVVDETSRRVAEARLRERARQLAQALRDVDAFATLAAHDLREPLRKIQLLADRALGRALPLHAAETLHRVRRSAAVLEARVAALHRYSRIGVTTHAPREVDLGAIVRAAEDEVADAIEREGATVIVAPMPRIFADPVLLRELFAELLAHALRSRRAGVAPVVRIAAQHPEPGRVVVTVADNGVGLGEDEGVFGVFLPTGSAGDAGSGVGLAYCRRIVEIHGGEITVSGIPGEGTVFTFSLPIQPPLGIPEECLPADVP
jgi:signal transduction histidine kinase